jgi:hypothetical protein
MSASGHLRTSCHALYGSVMRSEADIGQSHSSGRCWAGWATACSPAGSARPILSRSLCQLKALQALVRALYAGTQELSCAPEGQPSCTFYP